MANEINTFFANVGPDLASKIPDSPENNALAYFQMNHAPVFEFSFLSCYDIAILLRDFKSSGSTGVDGISSRLLKAAGPGIVAPLQHIFNHSIAMSTFPSGLKTGCITPLFKEGDATDPANYRPISILSCLGKLLERAIHTQLTEYFTHHSIYTQAQSGFRKGYFMFTCLLDFLENIFPQVDKGDGCGVLFLDLRKAFDTFDHQILISKFEKYGI